VTWTSPVGASANSNSLTKTASTAWGNGGAVSAQTLPSGDGLVAITASETNTYRLFGLGNGNSSQSYQDLEFGLYLYTDGTLLVYEAGLYRGTFGPYATGDILQVAVDGGVVKYKRNGTTLYTSTLTPTYPLLVDTAIYNQGATLNSATISGNWGGSPPPPPPPPSGQAVTWTSLAGVSGNSNSLTKTASTAWGNGGAVSAQTLPSGDGLVAITASETNTYRLFGLGNGNSSQSYEDIEFGLYLYSDGTLLVFEGGLYRGTFGPYSTGDILQVAVEGGVVKYKRNGTTLYTSTLTPTFPLLVDTAIYNQGATLNSATISGNWQ
jgi:hypothetical protein